jgi:hypothetical protein
MRRLAVRLWKPVGIAIALLAVPQAALAGPPYITDDPMPTDLHHWEIYAYSDNGFLHREMEGESGLDMNYGLAKHTQLSATIAGAYANGDGRGLVAADTEIGIKYAFIHNEAAGFHVSFFPKVILPTSPGRGRVSYDLPVWAQKDWGKWSLFGGGGPTLRSGYGAHNSWQEGIALNRQITDGFALGIEAAHNGPEADGERGSTAAQIGTSIHLRGPFTFMTAAGPTIEDHTGRTGAHMYAAILTNF